MSTSTSPKPQPRPLSECSDVYDVLRDNIQLRPGMWVRSLKELEIMLHGYGVALQVHRVTEPHPFSINGKFSEWLRKRFGWGMSLGWAYAIEKCAKDEAPLDMFFRLAEEYRLEQLSAPQA
jgi:hypothetical protein